jgi:phosphoribosyl-AMP cyclohydrolase
MDAEFAPGGALDVSESSNETPTRKDVPFLSQVKWSADGLVPAIVQDAESGEVLMLAWMDEPALRKTFETRLTHFYSRSRRRAWHKGETSGHVQHVVELRLDCDADVVLVRVRQVGGACHEGYRSCFFRRLDAEGRLERVAEPVFSAERVYGPPAGSTEHSASTEERR